MKIGVIGGGITGLTTAFNLAKQGHLVEVFEKEDKLGGLAKSLSKNSWSWSLEGFFHHFFTSDSALIELLKEIGLSKDIFYKPAKSSVYDQGLISRLDTPIDFLKFPNLDLISKIRMGGILFLIRLLPFSPFWEKYSADKLFPILFGKKAWQAIWEKLMKSKFGSSVSLVSSSWLWARLKVRSKQLGYLNGGSQKIFDRLSSLLKEKKGRIYLKKEVVSLKKQDQKIKIVFKDGKYQIFDKVVLALPLPISKDLIKNIIDEKTFNDLNNLKSIGALTLILRLKKPFLKDNVYWLNILEQEFPFVALVEHTNFVNKKYYGNEHIVYLGNYCSPDNLIFKRNKKEVWQQFLPFLKKINPDVEKNLIGLEKFSSFLAQPIIPINYSKKMPPMKIASNKIFLVSPNHIFPWDRGMNYSVALGKSVAGLV